MQRLPGRLTGGASRLCGVVDSGVCTVRTAGPEPRAVMTIDLVTALRAPDVDTHADVDASVVTARAPEVCPLAWTKADGCARFDCGANSAFWLQLNLQRLLDCSVPALPAVFAVLHAEVLNDAWYLEIADPDNPDALLWVALDRVVSLPDGAVPVAVAEFFEYERTHAPVWCLKAWAREELARRGGETSHAIDQATMLARALDNI